MKKKEVGIALIAIVAGFLFGNWYQRKKIENIIAKATGQPIVPNHPVQGIAAQSETQKNRNLEIFREYLLSKNYDLTGATDDDIFDEGYKVGSVDPDFLNAHPGLFATF